MSYTLAIDQGTHASRALLFDQAGYTLASHWCEVGLLQPHTGCVEQNPDELLASIRQVVTELLQSLDTDQHQSITACGICTQRSTVVACTPSGKALSPALSWQDRRGADFLNTLKSQHHKIQALSGLPASAHYGGSKMRWLLQHSLTHDDQDPIRLAPLVSFLLLNLLDGHPYIVDHSNAQRSQLMDIKTLHWSSQLLDWFQIPANSLPAIKPLCADYGRLMNTHMPVTAVCGDQNAAIYGAGNLPEDTALINLGSGAFVLCCLNQPTPNQYQLTGISYSDANTIGYLREGTINGAGTALSWANQQFQLGDLQQCLPEWLARVKDPPVFINTIGGVGSPWWQTDIQPQWVGTPADNKADIAVSIIESILFLLQDNLILMQQEQPIHQLRVSGGLSRLDGLCQKLANLAQLPVARMDNPEATARGIAWLAAGRPAHWQPPAMQAFSPQADSGLDHRYRLFSTQLAKLISENDKP